MNHSVPDDETPAPVPGSGAQLTALTKTIGTDPICLKLETTDLTAIEQLRGGRENIVPPMKFKNLQDDLNALMQELQIQENMFDEQVRLINERETGLCSTFEKIAKVQTNVDTLKMDNFRINEAVEFIKGQQTEMELFLTTVESSMLDTVVDVEPNRQRLGQLTVDVNRELVQLGLDLSSVIQHINEQNNSAVEKDCSVSTILKILNEHTDILTCLEEGCDKVKESFQDIRKGQELVRSGNFAAIRRQQ